jgi:hypothetical protein
MTDIVKMRRPLLALIAVSQVFSSVLFVPGGESLGLSVFRLVLLLAGIALGISAGMRNVGFWPRRILALGTLLAGWMAISLIWSPDIPAGVRQLSYLLTTMLLLYVVESIVTDRRDFLYIAKVMAWSCGVILLLSFYELQSGVHFFRAALQDLAESDLSMSYIAQDQAWFTFGNPNDLAVHLAMTLFFAALFIGRSGPATIVVIVLAAGVAYLADALDARITIIAIAIFLAMYGAGAIAKRGLTLALLVIAAIVTSAALLGLGLALMDRAEFLDVSTFIRLQLISSGMQMMAETFFVGIGAGGFEFEMWASGFVGRTYGIVNPHNGLIRMAAENGIVGLTILSFILIGPVVALCRTARTGRLAAFVASVTVAFLLLFSVGSDPLSSSSLQLALALLWVACRLMDETAEGDMSIHSNAQLRQGDM